MKILKLELKIEQKPILDHIDFNEECLNLAQFIFTKLRPKSMINWKELL